MLAAGRKRPPPTNLENCRWISRPSPIRRRGPPLKRRASAPTPPFTRRGSRRPRRRAPSPPASWPISAPSAKSGFRSAQEVRALAYRFRLLRVVEEYHEQVARACAVAEGQLAAFRSGRASVAITSFQLVKPRMLHDDNWEAHALLGRRAVELILTIDDLSLRLAQFDQAIRTEGTRTDSSFANATISQPDVKEAGQPTHVQEHAIVDYAQVLDQLRAALAALIVELEEPNRTLPWHKLPLRGLRRAARVTTNQAARAHRPTPQGGSNRQFAR
jgi:hypothetical protein